MDRSTTFSGADRADFRALFLATIAFGLTLLFVSPVFAEDDLLELSLEDLMDVEVTSVSRKAQSRTSAAAAVTVITSEDIRRSGFTSVPEALRLVPGVQVARIDASRWAISIRGLRQEFANKLLVMIDGRSIYTPLFGGVVWNENNIPMADIERIEVVRGPGGTIWGANAVNGVINIISKSSSDTQGVRAHYFRGTREEGPAARLGGKIGSKTHFRVSGAAEKTENFDFNQNENGNDEYGQLRFGFRSDTEISDTQELTVIADYYEVDRATGDAISTPFTFLPITGFNKLHYQQRGGDVLVKFGQEFSDGSRLTAKTYYDRVSRDTTSKEDSHTVDLELEYQRNLTDELSVVLGGNYRYWTTHTRRGSSTITFADNDEDFSLGSGFIQFQLDLFDDKLALIAGTKLSVNAWSGFEYQPSGRIAFKPVDGHSVWAAVSRAVRTPTMVDRQLRGTIGPFPISGNDNFRSEELLSYELGYRFFALDWITAEFSAFWSDYDDYSFVNDTQGNAPFPGPFVFTNNKKLETRGGEIEVNVMPTDWIRVTLGYSFIDFDEDAPSNLVSTLERNTNPQHQAVVRTHFDLPANVEFDAAIYYVERLRGVMQARQDDQVESYVRLDLRLGWRPVEYVEIALVGQNLADSRHAEFDDIQFNQSTQVPRTGYAKVTVDF